MTSVNSIRWLYKLIHFLLYSTVFRTVKDEEDWKNYILEKENNEIVGEKSIKLNLKKIGENEKYGIYNLIEEKNEIVESEVNDEQKKMKETDDLIEKKNSEQKKKGPTENVKCTKKNHNCHTKRNKKIVTEYNK